jgi:predicted HicB family RNase H-like nuclease
MKDSCLEYRGYQGSVHFNKEDRVFFGKVEFIPALISYEGTDVNSLTASFEEAVDDYLELCAQQGKKPARPFKGSFNVRVTPELHKRACEFAREHHENLNSVVSRAIEKYLDTANS